MKTFLTACLLLLATSAFAQPRPGAFTTLFTTGFGTPIVASAGGTGGNQVSVRNTTAGTGNYGEFAAGNDTSARVLAIQAFSTTFTPTGPYAANGAGVTSTTPGGLALVAFDGAGTIRFASGGNTERMRLFASGGVSIGNTTDPGATNLYVTGSIRVGTILFANLTSVPDGTLYWCTDCTPGAICSGSGNGALAVRFNGISFRCL